MSNVKDEYELFLSTLPFHHFEVYLQLSTSNQEVGFQRKKRSQKTHLRQSIFFLFADCFVLPTRMLNESAASAHANRAQPQAINTIFACVQGFGLVEV